MKPELELELDELFAVELDELLFPLPPFPPFPPLPAELPVPLLEEEPAPDDEPTAPFTAVTVPAIGAVSTVPSTACWAVVTAASAEVTWAEAEASVAASELASWARVCAAYAALRLALAVSRAACAAVGSTLARICPLVTVSPTLTSISVTVPAVPKLAAAVTALATEPDADTVWVTGTMRVRVLASAAVADEPPRTIWTAHSPPATANTASAALIRMAGRRHKRMATIVAGRAMSDPQASSE